MTIRLTSLVWRLAGACSLVALLGLVAAVPAASQSPALCRMNGFVINPEGKGIPDAFVRLAVENGPGEQLYTTTSGSTGSYSIEFPLPTPGAEGVVYVERRAERDGVLQMTGAIDFRNCRQDRNIFVNTSAAVTPGPAVPSGPGLPPAYPPPPGPPAEAAADVLIYADLRSLPFGGLVAGTSSRVPICVSSLGVAGHTAQIDRVQWQAGFPRAQLQLSSLLPVTTDFETATFQSIDNDAGQVSYSAISSDPVSLPRWPDCTRIATVDVRASWTLKPGDVTWLMSLSGSQVRLPATPSISSLATRMTTYLDVSPALRVYLPIIARASLRR